MSKYKYEGETFSCFICGYTTPYPHDCPAFPRKSEREIVLESVRSPGFIAPVCDNCNAPAPRKSDGTPRYPTCHGSSVGLCQKCAREAISL